MFGVCHVVGMRFRWEREDKGGGRREEGDGLDRPARRSSGRAAAAAGSRRNALPAQASRPRRGALGPGQMLWLLPVSDGPAQVKGSWPTDAGAGESKASSALSPSSPPCAQKGAVDGHLCLQCFCIKGDLSLDKSM